MRLRLLTAAAVSLALLAGEADSQAPSVTAPVLIPPAAARTLAAEWRRYPLFAAEVERARTSVETSIRTGVNVPLPKDGGGGVTHEQHKRNYRAIYDAGLLFRITGERRYADHARDLLLAYADLYPKLGPHPARRGELAGRLFWQTLNDSVWLVHGVQGYDAIRATLPAEQRRRIDDDVFRRMARFLSQENPRNFDRIHNHATWAVAGVGMTGYVLRDPALVKQALSGLDGSGRFGFLRQLDLLFSPDGYYEEGPYYQRYAIMPFAIFARAIEANEPGRRIFEYRNGILPKAFATTIQGTYAGRFIPINDALPEKSLRTEELFHAVGVGYGRTRDPAFLSIAEQQGRTILSPDGLAVARDLAAGKARPFPFRSVMLRDGPQGDRGGLALLRSGAEPGHQLLVMKNTTQGQGHGHFDKMAWLLFDNGREIAADYGAARFLNIESKGGGGYLPENTSWAKQTVAHNTLVVNERSHFDGKLEPAEKAWPNPVFFEDAGRTRIVSARMEGTYPGVRMARTLAMLGHPDLSQPVVVDLFRVSGPQPAQYDLPLHYRGHLTDIAFTMKSNPAVRPVLGTAHGYQHLWADGTAAPSAADARVTWINGERFYSYRWLPQPGAELIAAESGANDPQFNLRREPVLIQRVKGARDAVFVSVLEPHGEYNPQAEYTIASQPRVTALSRVEGQDADVITLELTGGKRVVLAVAHDADPAKRHRVVVNGRPLEWTGFHARFDQ